MKRNHDTNSKSTVLKDSFGDQQRATCWSDILRTLVTNCGIQDGVFGRLYGVFETTA